jgi:hypothetical protein
MAYTITQENLAAINGLLRLIRFLEVLADSRPHIATRKNCDNFARVFSFHHREASEALSRHEIAGLLESTVLEGDRKRTMDDVSDALRSRRTWIQ